MNLVDLSLPNIIGGSLIFYFGSYLIISGFFYWLYWSRNFENWRHRKSQQKALRKGQIKREFLTSSRSIILFSMLGITNLLLSREGLTRVYFDINEYSWWWFAMSIIIYLVVQDAWFYWTHRIMHHRYFFRWMHAEHHRSTNPTPWACYSFSLPEAFVQGIIFLMLAFIIPIHPLAFVLVYLNQQLFNTHGHLGFEFLPRWWVESWIGRFYNTPTHHNMHHQFVRGNYGLYANVWDRLMQTNFANYESHLRDITEEPLLKSKEN